MIKTKEFELFKGLPKVCVPVLKGLPLIGDEKAVNNFISEASLYILRITWDGHIDQLISLRDGKDIATEWEQFPADFFRPIDKSGLPLFGVSAQGKVIFGIGRYEGDANAENPLERNTHYYIKTVTSTNPWA